MAAGAAPMVLGVGAGRQGQVQFTQLFLDVTPRGPGRLVRALQHLLGGQGLGVPALQPERPGDHPVTDEHPLGIVLFPRTGGGLEGLERVF